MNEKKNKANFVALIPFLVFIISYLGIGLKLIADGDPMGFYGFKSPIAVILGIICAFILIKGNINEKFDIFVRGCGDENIIIMCIIYILAGAFSTVSKAMGGVDATVNLGLSIIPPQFITVGIFIIACFISISTGTSVGTIVALGPIAVGFGENTSIPMALIVATLVSGAMFGDNLSVISDTTIAATRTQGVEMKDKFRTNISMAVPAMIITVILLVVFGQPETAPVAQTYEYDLIKVLPYVFVLVTAIAGMNVFVVLTLGTILSGVIGLSYGAFGLLEFTNNIYDGFVGMFEIFLLSMLTGGLAGLVTYGGGLDWLLNKIKSFIKGEKSAEVGIAAITALTDAATANNTVAIIIDGPIARSIAEEYKVDPRRSASLLDCFGAIMQGFIPYGAQLLIAAQFTEGKLSPFDLMPLLWYQFALAFFVILSIFVPFANGYLKKNPWNFEEWKPL
ncbi:MULTISPECIES: Na+/H+ antiporter NhaC family protein [Peptoniphilus]|uniref:Na+/H+ antiporter NhaC family protein n=1 Tax=Peptoniphilus TaxID=162289 RepID=UPI0001DA9FE2|nr:MULTISPECIES: Na+/H+ antiporter NhaC family protein [Peptoniphilus]EFI41606.1 Na+/H+ antiporter family protein [Peptoniphilus sp. oral taxon 386 str. F0131]